MANINIPYQNCASARLVVGRFDLFSQASDKMSGREYRMRKTNKERFYTDSAMHLGSKNAIDSLDSSDFEGGRN